MGDSDDDDFVADVGVAESSDDEKNDHTEAQSLVADQSDTFDDANAGGESEP